MLNWEPGRCLNPESLKPSVTQGFNFGLDLDYARFHMSKDSDTGLLHLVSGVTQLPLLTETQHPRSYKAAGTRFNVLEPTVCQFNGKVIHESKLRISSVRGVWIS
jgi:hypothetical protein